MILPWHKLNPSARRALICHALYWQAVAVGTAFFNIYLFRLGGGGYAKPALYQIFANACIPLGFWLGSYWARRLSSAFSYRAGLLAHLGFLFSMLLLREKSAEHLVWMGCLSGLATGLYWQGWILLTLDLSEDETRDAMIGTQQFVMFAANLTGAPLAGLFLSRFLNLGGYVWVFGASALLFLLAVAISLPLRSRPLHGGSSILRLLRIPKPPGWRAMEASSALMGLLSVSALFLSILIAYESKGNEGGTGAYNWVSALFGLASAWAVARLVQPSHRVRTLILSGLAVALVTLPLVFSRGFALILLYGAGTAVAQAFNNVPLFSTHLKILAASPRFHSRRSDALFIREVWINVGRVGGYAFLYFGAQNMGSGSLSGFFLAIALTPLLNALLIRKHA